LSGPGEPLKGLLTEKGIGEGQGARTNQRGNTNGVGWRGRRGSDHRMSTEGSHYPPYSGATGRKAGGSKREKDQPKQEAIIPDAIYGGGVAL